MTVIKTALILFFTWLGIAPCYACTIFYVYRNGIILAGNNEYWKDPNTRMWFYSAEENKHEKKYLLSDDMSLTPCLKW